MNIFEKFIMLIFLLCTFLVDLVAITIKMLFGIIILLVPDGIRIFSNYIDLEMQILSDDLLYIQRVLEE